MAQEADRIADGGAAAARPIRGVDLQGLLASQLQADTRHFIAAWRRWRGGLLLPRRADMNLRDIVRCLDVTALFEPVDRQTVTVRVVGTRLAAMIEHDATGRNLRDLTAPADWPLRGWRFAMMAAVPCGGFMTFRDRLPSGRVMMFETVSLPLDADDPARPRQILSCLTPVSQHFEAAGAPADRAVPLADCFAFVDIGNGMPAAGVA